MANKEFSMEYDRHDFTDEEKLEMSKELSRIYGEAETAEDELKAVKSDFKSRIDRMTADIAGLAGKLRSGYEMRRVKCEVNRDYKTGKIFFIGLIPGPWLKNVP